ncbi:hypothetical protein P5673_004843 [Acropora cervicornis]|uniref:Uncharacterized protein n=1 Tax=Acropora cervicornis TaxID=6130 RepID=A0AAD9VDN1_ACRCE|nr:hypothetical protein P5673_004843 [Acropora cervicornis]
MKGQIEVKDLSLVYYKGGPEVLTDFNWSVVSLVEQAPTRANFICQGGVNEILSRKGIKGIDKGKFKGDILHSDIFENCSDTLADLVHRYDLWLMCLINMLPCAKRSSARGHWCRDFIEENNSDQRKLFVAAKTLLNQGDQRSVFPLCGKKLKFANQIKQYFVEEMRSIPSKRNNLAFDLPIEPHVIGADVQQYCWHLVKTMFDSSYMILGKKLCSLDPMSTYVALDYLDILLPIITRIIN